MFKEFKQFIVRGNILDLAVAFILGIAFGKVVSSFVNNILMPPIGMALGKVDFSNLFVNLSDKSYATLAEAQAAGAPTINYGLFVNALVDFIIISFVVFLIVKMLNRYRPAPAAMKDCPYCATKIPESATRCPQCTSELK